MFFGVLAGAVLGVGFLLPGTYYSAILIWIAALLLYKSAADRPLQGPLLCGVVAHLVGFHWIAETVSRFGGLPWIAGIALLFLFAVAHAAYFPLASFIALTLGKGRPFSTAKQVVLFSLTFALLENSPLRLFPWQLGASQFAFPIAQIADIAGANLVTFVVLLCSGLFILPRRSSKLTALATLALATTYGLIAPSAVVIDRKINVALVQANVSIEDKHNEALITTNVKEYVTRTNELKDQDLVVWPESVIIDPLPLFISEAKQIIGLDQLASGKNILIGAISGNYNTIGALTQIYNSGLQIVNGDIISRYHKRFLVPFGETVPFIDTFPWLINFTPFLIPISPGRSPGIMTYSSSSGDFKTAPLICYEDILPWMAREGSALGADILVNLTNDAWFGGGVALSQHHLLASFRAIENRRSLVRSTNTGLTGIIDPFGKTIAELPKNVDGTLLAQVPISRYKSFYTRFGGSLWLYALVAIIGLLTLQVPLFSKKGKR